MADLRKVKAIGESEKTYIARTKWVKHNTKCPKCKEWLAQFNLAVPKHTKNKRAVETPNKCDLGRRLYRVWQKTYPSYKKR